MEATKTKPDHSELSDRIAAVERRLENRRTRLLDDVHEAGHAAGATASRALPLAAALGAGVVALYLTRKATRPKPRYGPYGDYVEDVETRRRVRWASLAGIVGTAFRIATSPQFRAIVRNFRERRGRSERY